jgi:hypothetical protein
MKNETFFVFIYIFLAIFLGLGILLGIGINEYFMSGHISSEVKNVSECSNLSLIDTAKCFRDYIKPFYNYTIRDS